MSMMSSAPFAFAIQNAFSRASISCAAAAGGSTYTSMRAELGELLGERLRRPPRAGPACVLSITTTR